MAINKKFTEYELEIIKLALNQLDLTGKIDVACRDAQENWWVLVFLHLIQ
jgi:hypothetical protein